MANQQYDHLGGHWRVRDPRAEGELGIIGPFHWLTLPALELEPTPTFSRLLGGNGYLYVWQGSDNWTVSIEQQPDYNQGLLVSFNMAFGHSNGSRFELQNIPEQMCRDIIGMLGGEFATGKYSPAPPPGETMTDISATLLEQLQAQLSNAGSLQDVQNVVNRAWKLAEIGSLNMQLSLFMTALGLAEVATERNCPNLQTLGAAAAAAQERIEPASLQASRLLLEEYRAAKAAGQPVPVWP